MTDEPRTVTLSEWDARTCKAALDLALITLKQEERRGRAGAAEHAARCRETQARLVRELGGLPAPEPLPPRPRRRAIRTA